MENTDKYFNLMKKHPIISIFIGIIFIIVIAYLYNNGNRLKEDIKIYTEPINLEIINEYKQKKIKDVSLGVEKCKKNETSENIYNCPNVSSDEAKVSVKFDDDTTENKRISLKEKKTPYTVTINKKEIAYITSSFLDDLLKYDLKLSNLSEIDKIKYIKINGVDEILYNNIKTQKVDETTMSFKIKYNQCLESYKPLKELALNINIADTFDYKSPKAHFFDKSLFSNNSRDFLEIRRNKLKVINNKEKLENINILELNSEKNIESFPEFLIKFNINNIKKNTVINFYQTDYVNVNNQSIKNSEKVIWKLDWDYIEKEKKNNDKKIGNFKVNIRDDGLNLKEGTVCIANKCFEQRTITTNKSSQKKDIKEIKKLVVVYKKIPKNKCEISLQMEGYEPFKDDFYCEDISKNTKFTINIEKTEVGLKSEVFTISDLKTGESINNSLSF